jgi:hypothetical protein
MDRLVVGDSIAQPSEIIEFEVEATTADGSLEGEAERRLPQSPVVLMGKQRPPKSEWQLCDDLAPRRAGSSSVASAAVTAYWERGVRTSEEAESQLSPISSASVMSKAFRSPTSR